MTDTNLPILDFVLTNYKNFNSRATRDALLARYAARLEHYVHAEPYNWFNFYDFWQQDRHAAAPDATLERA